MDLRIVLFPVFEEVTVKVHACRHGLPFPFALEFTSPSGKQHISEALQFCCFHSVTSVSFTGDTGGLYQDYDFATPVQVDSFGGYISHDVSRHERSRRSLSETGSSVHYHVSAFGKELHLDLQPSHVLAKGFTIQTLGAEGINTATLDPSIHNCLYQGSIRNHSESSVAISTCTGLRYPTHISTGAGLGTVWDSSCHCLTESHVLTTLSLLAKSRKCCTMGDNAQWKKAISHERRGQRGWRETSALVALCLTVGADAPDHCGSLPWSTAVFTAWAFAGTASALGVPCVYFATCETGGVGACGIKHTGA
ncbi:A disintegrin and metalloproteinase with thrombospondin motifs 18 [Anabarilius grahami]|uniref:A disintegrin and metalloproteinase with thrombospondin motifs 18 n=1 Tax=Anabarilius grahami TaxID=495550 RepID=A0A3N0YQ61_ANAGA|nr:A disintegrin and metalloproteinase with thrombospondin motifs 18 [Anabarilius grahami]